MSVDEKIHPYFEELLKKSFEGRSVTTYVLSPKGYINEPPDLRALLGHPKLSDIAQKAIDALEDIGRDDSEWKAFKWRLWAFTELQDVFDIPFYSDAELENAFKSWYFYYESLFLLKESITVGLNGFYNSSSTSLRSFLEFSVLQNYHNNIRNKSSSYSPLHEYLKNGHVPRWAKISRNAVGDVSFAKIVVGRLDMHYKTLSNSSSHPYHPKYSPKHLLDNSTSEHSALGIQSFWRTINYILESVLWLYYSNFPIVFLPVNTIIKFGFNPPVGIFIHLDQEHIFKNSLQEKDYEAFKEFALNDENARGLISWFSDLPDLDLQQIQDAWNLEDGEFPKDFEIGRMRVISKMRSLKEVMALKMDHSIFDSNLDPSKVDISLAGIEKYLNRAKKK